MCASAQSRLEILKTRRPAPGAPPGGVVIGGDYQGLGIVRSLGRLGVPICVIDDERSIARFSRFATCAARVPDLRDEQTMVDALMEAGERLGLGGWVLFPTRDEMVGAISRQRERLSTLFRVPTPRWETVSSVWDKRKTYRLARELGIPIPETWMPETAEELGAVTGAFPLAVKPAIKEHFFYATKAKAWRANTPEELRTLFDRAVEVAGPGEIMIQDLIPGYGRNQLAYCAFFKEGRVIGSMMTRERRQHPHEFGRASTFVETIDMPELERHAVRFLKAIDYYGLVSVEFKLDSRDGQLKLLDVNPRTWGYHSLGRCAGVDFPALLYQDQLGRPVTPCRGEPGLSWIRLLTDTPTALLDIWKRRLAAGEYVKSLMQTNVEAVFSLRDPMPGLVECALLPYLIVKRGF